MLAIPLSRSGLYAQDQRVIDSLTTLLETTDGEAHVDILYELSRSGHLDEDAQLRYARRAIEYAEDLDNDELIVEASINYGQQLLGQDRYTEAMDLYREIKQFCEENEFEEGLAEVYYEMGRTYDYMNNMGSAMEELERSREVARQIRNQAMEARAVYWMGEVQRRNSAFQEAIGFYEEAMALAAEANDPEIEARSHESVGLIFQAQGDYQQSIQRYEKAIPLFEQAANNRKGGILIYRLGNIYFRMGDYDRALEHWQRALPIFEEMNFKAGVIAIYQSMAALYDTQHDFEASIEMNEKALDMNREIGNPFDIANSLQNLGVVYHRIADDSLVQIFGTDWKDSILFDPNANYEPIYAKAIDYYQQALEIKEEIGDRQGTAMILQNMGASYMFAGRSAEALGYLERAHDIFRELNDRAGLAIVKNFIGLAYFGFNNYTMAEEYLSESLELAREINIKETIKDAYKNLAQVSQMKGQYEDALQYYKLYFSYYDTLTSDERQKLITEMQVKYETEATEKENALLLAQREQQDTRLRLTRIILIITILAIGVFIVLLLQLIRQNNLKKKANRELAQKNELITEQKKEITDSIQYASRIQNAMLPPGDYMDSLMPDRFILFMPRDIVSGDYYYITEKDDKIICVAADCTGHGVPGAFMSMLGIAFLNEIISKHEELHTDQILDDLRKQVITHLHQTGKEGESQDGMDVALYIFDPVNRQIEFSGANNSLLVCRDGKLIEAKADKMPIGIHTRAKEPFTRHNLQLEKGDMIYTYSDGYPDQFGGPKQKKFMIRNFKKMLREIHQKDAKEQLKIMQKTLKDWMADAAQVDDILVIGVRV